MERVVGAAAAAIPVMAAAATGGTMQPTEWHFFGYPFEAAGMVAALFGCFTTRFWLGAGAILRKQYRWLLDVPVGAITLAASAGAIISVNTNPLLALLIGTGIGMIGEGLFHLAEKHGRAALGAEKPE